jgi:hypothetical protein
VCITLQDIEERGVGLERLTAAAREMVRDSEYHQFNSFGPKA